MFQVPSSKFQALKGVSLIELLVSMAIVAVLAGLGTMILFGRRGQVELEGTAQQMSILLKEARSRSISQASSTSWGVHFENATNTAPFYALFATGTYSTSTRINYNRLPQSVGYVSSSLPFGASTDIVFDQMTGSATTTNLRIYLIANPANSSTISVSLSGLVDWVLGIPTSTTTAPSVLTLAASGVSTSTAVLNGSVNPNGLATAAWFEWGTSGSFGSSTASSSLGSGSSAVAASASLSGLAAGTTYYFRADAQSSAGTTYGSALTFTTTGGTGVISSSTGEHYAWSDNFGWIEFLDPNNITVSDSQLAGYASSTSGYVLLDCATAASGNICATSNFKVSNTSAGVLSGYAWNDTIGWISMNCSDPGICATSNYSVTIDASGNFSGWAWNENVGWISFNCSNTSSCATSNYKLKTTWTH